MTAEELLIKHMNKIGEQEKQIAELKDLLKITGLESIEDAEGKELFYRGVIDANVGLGEENKAQAKQIAELKYLLRLTQAWVGAKDLENAIKQALK